MHGLVNRSIQNFLSDTYGQALWQEVSAAAELGFDGFEPMLSYDDALTEAVLCAAAARLDRGREGVLEDIGTYLVSHPNLQALRRLLRFGGVEFSDFLYSLEDLQARGRLAVPELDLPRLELQEHSPERFTLTCQTPHGGFGHAIVGVLRAMADDYGALVLLEHVGSNGDVEMIGIDLLDHQHAEGRRFELAAAF